MYHRFRATDFAARVQVSVGVVRCLVLASLLGACGSDADMPGGQGNAPAPDGSTATGADAAPAPTPTPDAAAVVKADAPPAAEDLDMQLQDFANIQGFTVVSGPGYSIVNKNHMTEALAVANSSTGGKFPVGTIILNPGANGTTIKEYSVK